MPVSADSKTKTYYCEECKRLKRAEEFYTSNNREKYPNDGKLTKCKDCITMFVDNWKPETYVWILQELDVPYVPDVWTETLQKYGKNRSSLTGKSIIGRYLSKMKLNQYGEFRWADTEFLQEIADNKIKESMQRQGYSAQEIAATLNDRAINVPEGGFKEPENPALLYNPSQMQGEPQEDYFSRNDSEEDSIANELTEEDKKYLKMKWGKSYKPDEWVWLEQLFNDMMNSYDVQSAGHVDTLKLACKSSLKSNQLLDIGDIDGAQKAVKMYDSLMKSGKFTAAQNKAESGEFVDSVCELIEMCEKQGYIERFYVETPNDKVDFTIQDMQRYTKTLIHEETNLTTLLEAAIKQNAREDEAAKENKEDSIVDDIDMTIEDIEKSLEVEDMNEYNDFIDDEKITDEDILQAMMEVGL